MESKHLHNTENLHSKYFMEFLSFTDDLTHIYTQICGNKDLQMLLALFILDNFKYGDEALEDQLHVSGFVINMIFSFPVLEKLVDEGICNRRIFSRYEHYANEA